MADVNWNDYTPVGAGAAPAAEPVDWSQFDVVKPVSTGRKLADIATAFAGGAVGATKAIADAGGAGNAVSQQLGSAQDTVQSWLSPQRQAEKAARAQTIREAEQSGSVLREVGAQLGGIAEAPVSTVAEAAGSVVPIVASMFTPVGRSAAARTALGAGLGAAQGAGSVKGSIHEAVEQQQREQGATPEAARQAADRAQAYIGPNADNIALGAGLGLVTGTTGVERLVSGALAGRATNQALLRRAATGAVTEGLPEAVQGGQERFASNVAQQREGGDVPTWQGVAGQAVAEGVAGGLLGAGTGAAVRGGHGAGMKPQAEPGGQLQTDAAGGTAAASPAQPGAQPDSTPVPDAGQPLYADAAGNVGETPEAVQAAGNAAQPAAAAGAPAIDPNAGPLSKAAVMAGDLGLAPMPVAPAAVSAQETMAEAMPRMTEEQQRAARIVEADLARDIPAGVRAAREAEARGLAAAVPAAEPDLAPADMEQGRILRNFEPSGSLPDVAEYAPLIEQAVKPELRPQYRRLLAEAMDENRAPGAGLVPGAREAAAQALHATFSPDAFMASRAARPDERLTLTPAERRAFGNEIDFVPAAAPAVADPAAEQINQLALAQQLQPGAPLRLDQAHGLRRQAAAAGIPVSVVPHPSGRGYDVQPTVRLPEEQRAAVPQAGPAVLGFDAGPSGRMVAGPEGVRPETRAEAVAKINANEAERQALEAERQRRTDLGMSNTTPVRPLSAEPTSPALAYDNSPSGRMVAGTEGVRPETRAEAVSVINQQRQRRQEVEAERARRADLGLSNLTRITPLDDQQDGAGLGAQPAPTPSTEVIDAPAREVGAGPASTITMPDGRPFETRAQAQAELQRQGLTSTHEAAPAQGDPSLGFVGQQRSAARPANWRTNAMQAGRVARGLGLEPRGKRLAEIVADIDAADAARQLQPAGVHAAETGALSGNALKRENPVASSAAVAARTAVPAGQEAPSQIWGNPTFDPSAEMPGSPSAAPDRQGSDLKSDPTQARRPASVRSAQQGRSAESSADPSPSAARAAQQQGRIEDFGETLTGARKMLYAEAYADGMAKAKALDVKAHPLSKTWPEPDYQKLLEGGTQPQAVALVRAMRDAVPTKPQSSWKLRGWSERVATLRDFADELLAGRLDPQAVRTQLNNTSLPTGIANQAALYEALGHERSLKGIEVHAGSYSMYDGVRYDPPRSIWTVSRQAKASAFGSWPRELAKGDTREAAIEAFTRRAAQLAAEQDAPARGATFEIYAKRAGGARAFFIGKKIGRNVAELKPGFQDIKAARQYLADNQAELEQLLTDYKAVPPVRSASNAPRIGEDYRKGADVSPQQFQDAFGFRGVQFGNYVEGPRRQQDLNQAYDALMDMAGVLSLPPRALSLGGRLGLAFGARGSGGVDAAAAHYEPGQVVINLTKRQAAGALGHEWWHAMDNYFSRQRGDGAGFMTEGERGGDGVREEMRAAFRDLRNTINATGMQERSRKLDDRRTKHYWTTGREMSARAFESYLIAKLQDQSAGNDFLANVVPASAFALEGAYPYPTAGELPQVREAFDRFFQTVDTRRGEDGSVMLFSATSDVPPGSGLTLEQAQKAVDDALSGLRTPPPVRIVLRSDELGVDAPDGVMGAAIPGEGRIVIVASAHRSADAVVETLFHEMFHLGVRNVLPGSDYVQSMLDLAKRDARVRQYAIDWKEQAPDAPLQLQVLRDMGLHGSDLTARYEALAIEEGLAVVAQELRAQQQAGTRMGLRIRSLANWLAGVAERMGMQRLAGRIRNMTYNEAERFVLRAIDSAGEGRTSSTAGGPAGLARYRTLGDNPASQRVGATLQAMTATNVKKLAGHKATDLRPLGLGFLGRRQLVDVYGDMLPELRTYSDLMARMDADKNEAGAGADQLAQNWAKLADERALAELMHDSTLAQMDPAADYVADDNRVQYGALRRRFEALTPEAREVYTKARDTYRQHMRDVRSAIKERIERAGGMSSDRKAAMLKRMDDEFFGHIKGVYFPLARFGQYVVVVKDADGKTASVSRAETMAEADAMRGQMLSAFPKDKGFSVGKVLKAKDFVAERDTVGRGFMEQLYGVLDKQGMDAAQRAELEDALGQLYLSSLPDLSWAKHGIHRKGTAGFSQDARRAFAQNVFHGASYLAKLRYGDQLQDQLGEMQRRVDQGAGDAGFDSIKGQQVVDEMVKRHDAAMNPKTNALSTALTSVGFMFHLGLSPASAMVNLTQTALVAYPVMGARWGFRKSAAALLKASQEAVRGKNDITGSLSPDEKAAFDEAVRSGVIDVTMAHDLAGIAQGEDRNVSHKLRPVMNAASWMFHHAEKFNRQVTFVAAYRLARETGTSQQHAYQDAVQATYDGHFDYSANNRPRVMQGNVARVLLLFKQYGQNMVYTLVRNAQQALAAAKPEDRAAARKALAGLLTTHAMAAGVLGLPMVTTLLAAASMLGGDDDEPWDAQVAMQNMLADAFGQKPAEVLSHGLSRLTPWDISGRVGLDRLILPDVQEGLEGQRLGESAMAAALGPVAGIGINALKGLQEMSEGRYQRGLETMAPSVLRGPLKAWRYETEGVKDKTGIVVQDQVDAAAVAGQAVGFSPSSVRNAYEGKAAIVGQDRALQARRSALVEQFAMAAMAKDEEGKAEAREAIQRFNEKNPARRIQPMQLAQSVRMREKRIRDAEDGVYLPKKRRDAMEAGRFAGDE
ncbi:hypothetical protein KDK82_2297 [Delftia sp. K82]|uniref:PLxRFG domain-containing protein n=1 Tax=Delftia sp. K82 TaxID=1472718 RepID=UPI000B4901A2|nr:PLxRFG domain-containing protein [Delftia sp. K82]OWG18817.1 hypothetical protein KDK82_2297 [Delftia sp. K82]